MTDPAPILQLVTAYWGSMTLFAANEVGLFTALSRGPKDAAALAAELKVAERPLRLLLQGAAGLGLLTQQDGRFANTALADTTKLSHWDIWSRIVFNRATTSPCRRRADSASALPFGPVPESD